ncbi:3-hydroxyacyl-CoA dehydrogenase NAD-binding domain-containing protein [Parahaliea mediterranea]|uniref:3-hydroxyacyl-CoA dehydrogenase NAD-binding domain-containing protein n=1 Tax=Parahaliea mediterranea TaxID=651086 RepID=UPI000E2E7A40|nr:3-hydroxyacyl-CoA dehydrogenase NAD-binding domain-containing protein [Parahaliea mediterranea]
MSTQRPQPEHVQTVGILGTGVIGGAWALHFLRMGKDVLVWDSAPGAEQRLRDKAAEKWPLLEQLGLREGADLRRLQFADSLENFCQSVDIIQESTPEDLAQKQALFAQLDALTPAHVVISSSTSGLLMTDIQKDCANPGRTVVCHPFNPPYMIPFCEVVGGEQSDDDAVDWAAAFFQYNGKQVARMQRELPGFIGNRLQDAIWREALHMVDNGECSVADIDKAISYGPGLRWAIMGPCANMALCGGEGGMQRMLDHFGPSLKEPWTRLEAPELTDTLYRDMIDGFNASTGGRSMAQLAEELDDCLIRIQQVLREYRETHGIER